MTSIGESLLYNMEKIRLQKFFTDAGICSRRAAEAMISEGRVAVNGAVAALGDRADPASDVVTLDGEVISYPSEKEHTYIMLNKPMGVVTTASDEKGRAAVTSLVADCGVRVYPVGRLDMYSQGLLLLTDDGELANALMHPSHGAAKVYRLTVKGEHGEALCASLCGVRTLDGYRLAPVECEYVGSGRRTKDDRPTSVYRVTLREGRNRQIRRMCAEIGVKVVRLERVAVGALRLGDLPLGKWRHLTAEEVAALKDGTK